MQLRALAFVSMLAACGRPAPTPSRLDVTDVDHTPSKRQTINNCWTYVATGWLEAKLKAATGEETDLSESYLTWWYWYGQIADGTGRIEAGGWWSSATRLLHDHGFVRESEFAGEDRQRPALQRINELLAEGGALHDQTARTPQAIRQALDEAFGAEMASAEAVAKSAATTVIGHDATGDVTVADALAESGPRAWQNVYVGSSDVAAKALLARAFLALNAREPVVMIVTLDSNAFDMADGTYKRALLDTRGPGVRTFHIVLLEDYTVTDAPGFGALGRGELPPEQKAAAAQGTLATLVAKNSWGASRPDLGMPDGMTTFEADYLLKDLDPDWRAKPLSSFILPPGF